MKKLLFVLFSLFLPCLCLADNTDVIVPDNGGMWLGTNGLAIALIIACILGTLWGKSKNQKYIPFTPFFFIGGFLSFITNLFLL